jgi:hypothetical protein
MPGGQTTASTVPSGQTVSSGSQTTQAQEACSPTKDEAVAPSSLHTEVGGQTMSPGGPTANSCKVDANSSANGIYSPTDMEEDANDGLLDYEPSPARDGIEINIIYLSSTDYSFPEEEEVSQLTLGAQEAVFKKPVESGDHLKPLYIHRHLDGTPVARMLVDGSATVNVMLGKNDAELIKMNMMITGIRGEGPIGPKGVASMELTVGSKMIPTAFFITEVQGNYNAILGHDWIHANHCVPSTLHQFLIQWVGEKVEIVHADVSVCVVTADSSSWSHYNIKCLSGQYISDCDIVSVSNDGFVPMSVKPVDDRLNLIM